MKQKAQFMELDILFAILILVSGILLLKGQYVHVYDSPQIETAAQDAVMTLQVRTMSVLGTSYQEELQNSLNVQQSGITINPDETIARQLTMILIAAEKEDISIDRRNQLYAIAGELVDYALEGVIQPNHHYNITLLSNGARYTLSGSNEPVLTASQARIMLSGLEVNKTIFGYSASAFLSSLTSEQASYVYFGGFVGQGNISVILDVPSEPLSFSLEGDFHDSFKVIINNTECAEITVDAITDINVISENLHGCLDEIIIGKNNISINFTGDDISEQYIGGGYLKATYLSNQVYKTPTSITKKHLLPGINGIFNLYDAVYISGELQSMNVYLHYFANHTGNNNTAFFTLGNTILLSDNDSTEEQTISLSASDLENLGINFDGYSNKSVPFRFGYDNGTIELLTSSVIDAVLVTDVSGSMGWRYDRDNGDDDHIGTFRECDDGDLYNVTTERLAVAKCASKNFTSLIINDEGQLEELNRIGLTAYNGILADSFDFTSEEQNIINEIDSYDAGGGTCICCGIVEAINLFRDDNVHEIENQNISRAMVIMTDGVANGINQECRDELNCEYGGIDPQTGDCANVGDAGDYAIAAADYAYNYYNISIYVVGFGTTEQINNNTLWNMAAVQNSSHYYIADSPGALTQIYNDIASDIIQVADYNAQIISFEVEMNESIIYPDSYIEYTYRPNLLPSLRGQLLLDGERTPFDAPDECEATDVNFPLALYPISGKITSYSGNHWTQYLDVNGDELYNLTHYGTEYRALGDPFLLGIPSGILDRGPNSFTLRTADNPETQTGCSIYNKLVYTATLNSTISLHDVYPKAEGCEWTVSMLGELVELSLPDGYEGNTCSYIPGNIQYDDEDAWQALGFTLFNSLDVDNKDGNIDISLTQGSLDVHLQTQENIPYLWGPSLLEVTIWQ